MDEVLARISRCLEEEDLKASLDAANRCWWVTFDIDGSARSTMLIHPPDDEYVIAATEIVSSRLRGHPLETLSAETLATLLDPTLDDTFLARVTYVPNATEYYATSACSIEGPSGPKLRRRMEAAARLAVTLERALSSVPAPRKRPGTPKSPSASKPRVPKRKSPPKRR